MKFIATIVLSAALISSGIAVAQDRRGPPPYAQQYQDDQMQAERDLLTTLQLLERLQAWASLAPTDDRRQVYDALVARRNTLIASPSLQGRR